MTDSEVPPAALTHVLVLGDRWASNAGSATNPGELSVDRDVLLEDLKGADDTIDIVGFLAFEMVRALTIGGLEVKRSLEEAQIVDDHSTPLLGKRKAGGGMESGSSKRRRGDEEDREDQPLPVSSLFLQPPEARTALMPEHIQDAFARMQNDWAHHRSAGMRNWRGGLVRTGVSLI